MFRDLLERYAPTTLAADGVLTALLTAIVCSGALAQTYRWSFRGLSWSPAFLHALILGGLIACVLMLAVGNNIAGAIGIIGSLAIVRFRTNLRDPRDMVFVFATMGVGVACGLQAWTVALLGTVVFCGVALLVHVAGFGGRPVDDGLVRFQAREVDARTIAGAIGRHASSSALISLREIAQGGTLDYAYQVRFRPGAGGEALIRELASIPGLSGATFMDQRSTVEV